MSKHLLISTDDFGMCHSVNLGIVKIITKGIATCTNFLVPCPWFEEAVFLAKQYNLEPGVHLCLTCDWDRFRWGPITKAASLTDKDGLFLPRYEALAGQAKEEDILCEYRAQIERVLERGMKPVHVDSHMLGSRRQSKFFDVVRKVIKKVGEEYNLIYTYETLEGKHTYFNGEGMMSLNSPEDIFQLLESWKDDGYYHLICHGAVASDELDSLCSPDHPAKAWASSARLADTAFCTDVNVRKKIEDMGFELITVTQLREMQSV